MGNPCQDFFQENAEPPEELVPKLVASGRGLEWSELSASEHSPGVVALEEILCRQVTHPHFYDEVSGEVTITLYSDVCSRGMSTNRLSHGTQEDFIQRGRQRANENKTFVGLVSFSRREVEDIHAQVDNIATSIRVFDTALHEDRSHADVCQVTGPTGRHATRQIRTAMFLAFKGRLIKAG